MSTKKWTLEQHCWLQVWLGTSVRCGKPHGSGGLCAFLFDKTSASVPTHQRIRHMLQQKLLPQSVFPISEFQPNHAHKRPLEAWVRDINQWTKRRREQAREQWVSQPTISYVCKQMWTLPILGIWECVSSKKKSTRLLWIQRWKGGNQATQNTTFRSWTSALLSWMEQEWMHLSACLHPLFPMPSIFHKTSTTQLDALLQQWKEWWHQRTASRSRDKEEEEEEEDNIFPMVKSQLLFLVWTWVCEHFLPYLLSIWWPSQWNDLQTNSSSWTKPQDVRDWLWKRCKEFLYTSSSSSPFWSWEVFQMRLCQALPPQRFDLLACVEQSLYLLILEIAICVAPLKKKCVKTHANGERNERSSSSSSSKTQLLDGWMECSELKESSLLWEEEEEEEEEDLHSKSAHVGTEEQRIACNAWMERVCTLGGISYTGWLSRFARCRQEYKSLCLVLSTLCSVVRTPNSSSHVRYNQLVCHTIQQAIPTFVQCQGPDRPRNSKGQFVSWRTARLLHSPAILSEEEEEEEEEEETFVPTLSLEEEEQEVSSKPQESSFAPATTTMLLVEDSFWDSSDESELFSIAPSV